MSYEKLIALGASPVAGKMYMVHQELGQFHGGELILNADGEAVLADAAKAERAAKAQAEAPADPAWAAKTAKAKKSSTPVTDADLDGLDELLASAS